MSTGFKIILGILSIPVILWLLLLAFFFFLFFFNPVDYFVARTIPIYPNSREVEVSSSTGFPGGGPGADIVFYMDGTQDQLLSFYSPRLKSQGWEEKVKYYNEGEPGIGNNNVLPGTKTLEAAYTKNIFNTPFTLSFSKTDLTNEQKYRDFSKRVFKHSDTEIDKEIQDQKRVIIFIDRLKRF